MINDKCKSGDKRKMLNAARVYSFKKNTQIITLFVDSVKGKDEYWLEIGNKDGELEESERVYSWNEAVGLLELHDWADYEYYKMDLSYADLIKEARGRSRTTLRKKKYNAQQRVLEILNRLERNETIIVKNAVDEFGVERTQIQRDMKALNEFFLYKNKSADYKRGKKGYELNVNGDYFTIDDALIVLLLLYGTRALKKEELKSISGKVIGLFSRAEQMKLREFFRSYLYHYQPVQQESLFELFYAIFQAISRRRILKFTYTNNKGETKVHEVIPFTITYHDSKFYLFARLKGMEQDEPRPWLLDKIRNWEMTKQSFTLADSEINVGEYIKQSFNMFVGDLQRVRLLVKDSNIPYVKRRFPDVSINPSSEPGWQEVRLEVKGVEGIKLWILQQGQFVKVLEPQELREKVKQDIAEMYQMYFEQTEAERS